MPTSKRTQVDDVQYPRIPSRILKGVLHGEVVDDVIAEVAMSEIVRRGSQKSVDLERVV
jgi:hypothetical protein